jgi:hypothetical protein
MAVCCSASACSPHRLADLEAFELRMVEVERLVLAGVPVGKTECFALGGGLLALHRIQDTQTKNRKFPDIFSMLPPRSRL